MSNKIIPKEQLTAYQRWELSTLDGADSRGLPGGARNNAGQNVSLPTAAEIERIQQQAYQEGFAAGKEAGVVAGRQEGLAQGYQEGRVRAETDAAHINRLLHGLGEALRQFDQQVAQDVVDLALEVAKQMLSQALRVKPQLVTAVIREAMNALPQGGHHPHLVLHPEDATLARKYLEAELAHSPYRIVEDPYVERGGCRIETHVGEIDATMETRWKMVVAALGKDGSWLE